MAATAQPHGEGASSQRGSLPGALEPRFPEEVSAIYERIVWELMKENADRKGYKEACRYIRRMKKLDQDNRASVLIEALRAKYSNRPALLDELSKV